MRRRPLVAASLAAPFAARAQVGATCGIGHMIMDGRRLLDMGQMILGIVVIGLIGPAADALSRTADPHLFPWASP